MIHVYKNIRRPDKNILKAYKELNSATVYEAAGRIGSVSPNVKPLKWGMKVIGPALTVQCRPGDNLMLHKAIQIAREGDVIVVDTSNYPNAGYWGELMTTSALALGIGGLTIDGCVRDSDEIVTMGFPVFCRGTCMRGTTKNGLGTINHEIIFGGVLVRPGDLIIGDNDGIVVVPYLRINDVLNSAMQRIKKEKEKRLALKKGITSVELNNLEVVLNELGMNEE